MREPSDLVIATWKAEGNLERIDDDSGASVGQPSLSFASEQESGAIVSGVAKDAGAGELMKETSPAKAQRRKGRRKERLPCPLRFFFAPLRLCGEVFL